MADPHFKQSVILLLEQDEKGAFGFVINHKSKMSLDEVVSLNQVEIPPEIPVWNAGPVDSSAGYVLHNQKSEFFEREIAPGISLSSSQESLKKLVDNARFVQVDHAEASVKKPVIYPFRLLVGYAGWIPGQLEAELDSGTWLQAPLDYDILFNANYSEIWTRTLGSVGVSDTYSDMVAVEQGHWLH